MGVVCVVGSANVDRMVRVDRYPELGETVLGEAIGLHPGGKGFNQAVAAQRSGAVTRFCGQVGDDGDGAFLLDALHRAGLDGGGLLVSRSQPTGSAHVAVLPGSGNSIVVAQGANGTLSPEAATAAVDAAAATVAGVDVVLVQLEIPAAAAEAALAAGRRAGALTILNAAPTEGMTAGLLDVADIVVVNETEAAALGGAEHILSAGPAAVIVTLGSRGAIWLHRTDGTLDVDAFLVDAVDTTGSGDAFCGALAAALSSGSDILSAMLRASAAGAIVATALGAQTELLSPEAIDRLVSAG